MGVHPKWFVPASSARPIGVCMFQSQNIAMGTTRKGQKKEEIKTRKNTNGGFFTRDACLHGKAGELRN